MERAPQGSQKKPSFRQRFVSALMEKMGVEKVAQVVKGIDTYNDTRQRFAKRKNLRPVWKHPLRRSHFGNFRPMKPLQF